MGFHIPFSVLVIGGIVGIFVFAASSAFSSGLNGTRLPPSHRSRQPLSQPHSLI